MPAELIPSGLSALALPWSLPLFALFVALPAIGAWRRRRSSREAIAVAQELAAYAERVRTAPPCEPMDDALRVRVARLGVAEAASLQLAQELERGGPAALADTAQRLALRLRRRVAFQRKMLARTAPGLRRGAIAATLPPLLISGMQLLGTQIPPSAQLGLLLAEAAGCALLWRLAQVEV